MKLKRSILKNKILNEDCFKTMEQIKPKSIDMVLTSPPYNTSRNIKTDKARKKHWSRYDIFVDTGSHIDYVEWTISLFNSFDKILKENGVILYNLNYGTDGDSATCDNLIDTIHNLTKDTAFTVADIIVWKKKSALPNNASPNKCTRIYEFIFVLCRKEEYKTFKSGKEVKSVSNKGQNFYTNMFNFIEAPNNDGSCNLNKATFSSDLVLELLKMYIGDTQSIVYDPFIGTGTTAIGVIKYNQLMKSSLSFIGSELSAQQCEFALSRIKEYYISVV